MIPLHTADLIITQYENENEVPVTKIDNHAANIPKNILTKMKNWTVNSILKPFFDGGVSFTIRAVCNFTLSERWEISTRVADFVSKN